MPDQLTPPPSLTPPFGSLAPQTRRSAAARHASTGSPAYSSDWLRTPVASSPAGQRLACTPSTGVHLRMRTIVSVFGHAPPRHALEPGGGPEEEAPGGEALGRRGGASERERPAHTPHTTLQTVVSGTCIARRRSAASSSGPSRRSWRPEALATGVEDRRQGRYHPAQSFTHTHTQCDILRNIS